jgi:hypothetical protein
VCPKHRPAGPIERHFAATREALLYTFECVKRGADLVKVLLTLRSARRLSRRPNGRQYKRREQSHDPYAHHKFRDAECPTSVYAANSQVSLSVRRLGEWRCHFGSPGSGHRLVVNWHRLFSLAMQWKTQPDPESQ